MQSPLSMPPPGRWLRGEDAHAAWQSFARARDPAMRQRLVMAYQGYARMMAARYYAQRVGDDIGFDEYFQMAQVGLIEAIDRYDPDAGVQFETFAGKRVAGAIVDGIARMTEVQQQVAEQRRRARERSTSLYQPPVSAEPLAADALFEQLAQLAVGLALGFTLDGLAGAGAEAAYDEPAYQRIEMRQLRELIAAAVRGLPDRVRAVISLHYLQQKSFAEIAAELELTASRISQLHRDGIERLRLCLKRQDGFDLRC